MIDTTRGIIGHSPCVVDSPAATDSPAGQRQAADTAACARTEPAFAVLIGFLFGSIQRSTGGGSGSSLDDLRPVLQCSDADHANLVRELNSPDPKFQRAAGLVGVLVGLAVLTEANLSHLLERATWKVSVASFD